MNFDRNIRTPYLHQYNTSVQYAVARDMVVEAAYVGTRGLNIFRQVAINQAQLVSPDRPIINEVTGAVITTNTPGNAALRAPFQGIEVGGGFLQDQTTAQSTYNSLQMSLTRRLSRGLQLLASYTFVKSIDNGSGEGGGSGIGAIMPSGGSIDVNTGQIISPGDFGRIISTSNNPRIIQIALKLNY